MKKTTHRDGARTQPAFQIIRQMLIRIMANADTPTLDIAKKLGHSRSFVIKQVTIGLKARTASERRLLKLAQEHESAFQRAGLKGLLGGEDIATTLAGGERPKLGTMAERAAKRAKAKKPSPKAAAKPAPKAKVVKAKAAAKPKVEKVAKPKATKAEPVIRSEVKAAAIEAARRERKNAADRARRAAKKAAAPEPEAASAAPASGDDLFREMGIAAEPDPAAPV